MTSASALVRVPHDLGEATEPLVIHLESDGILGMAHLYWNAVSGAQGYDVISGDVANLKAETNRITLGAVRVPGRLLMQSSMTEGAATLTTSSSLPERGRAFFYLVQYRDGHGASGYGTESVPLPLEPASCEDGCPGDEAQLGTNGTAGGRTR